ncbi:hypothetical protein DCAR_0520417 [Daucus carota subsp. sativus]|uniref:Uncharacterized protein n=1 Tax=Daucus carota subsp. sativus TaxID=79200 RepID=A0A164YIP5_DAUCS|nr:PREDICTED: uncharacterized protein LOC108220540 [Daucus carota subsp. sativus]WOH01038.1 hypothetical protein DCAR_0520417 [Daucus carota subsp. sativus]
MASSILNTNSSTSTVMLATAMAAVSGTVIVLALGLHKFHLPTSSSLISASDASKREKKKKRVQFAEDVVDPVGNSEEFRRRQRNRGSNNGNSSTSRKGRELQANRMALYNGILQDRVLHRTAYSSY